MFKEVFDMLDENGDGKISFEEFKKMMWWIRIKWIEYTLFYKIYKHYINLNNIKINYFKIIN